MDMTRAIQIAVAEADIILCEIAHVLPRLLFSFIIGFVAGRVVLKCLPKK